MSWYRWAAGTTAALVVAASAASAAEPIVRLKLGTELAPQVQGLQGGAGALTLKLDTEADTVLTHGRWYRSYRPYVYSYYPRAYAYSYGYRPYAYYSPPVYYYSPPVYYYSPPAYYSYPCWPMSGTAAALPTATTLGSAPPSQVAPPSPTLPQPRPAAPGEATYPYDGGPSNPVPLPRAPSTTPPATLPLEGRPVSLPAAQPRYVYPAYGETPAAPREGRILVIQSPAGRPPAR